MNFSLKQMSLRYLYFQLQEKYNIEVREVEKENFKLKDTIDVLNKTIKQKDERIIKLEIENTEFESHIRIIESSLESTKEKLNTITEKAILLEAEYEELSEKYKTNIERLREETKELREEIEAQTKKSLKNHIGSNPQKILTTNSLSTIEATTNENVSTKGLTTQSFTTIERISTKANELENKVIKAHRTTMNLLEGMECGSDNPKTLCLIDKLLDDINTSLRQVPLIN